MEKNKEAGFLNVSQGRSKSIPSVINFLDIHINGQLDVV